MKRLVLIPLLVLFLNSIISAQNFSSNNDDKLGISFSFPSNWELKRNYEDFLFLGDLQPKKNKDEYTTLVLTEKKDGNSLEVMKLGKNPNKRKLSADSLMMFALFTPETNAKIVKIGGKDFLKAEKSYGPQMTAVYYIRSDEKEFTYIMISLFKEEAKRLSPLVEKVLASITFR
jgi:hypothetical protein